MESAPAQWSWCPLECLTRWRGEGGRARPLQRRGHDRVSGRPAAGAPALRKGRGGRRRGGDRAIPGKPTGAFIRAVAGDARKCARMISARGYLRRLCPRYRRRIPGSLSLSQLPRTAVINRGLRPSTAISKQMIGSGIQAKMPGINHRGCRCIRPSLSSLLHLLLVPFDSVRYSEPSKTPSGCLLSVVRVLDLIFSLSLTQAHAHREIFTENSVAVLKFANRSTNTTILVRGMRGGPMNLRGRVVLPL